MIGAGVFGRHHLRILSRFEAVELAGVVDIDANRAAAAASEYGCPACGSIDQLAEGLDAAVVAVPTSAHAEVGCALLEDGVDVLMEKPIAVDVASGQRLVDTAARHGRILQVGHLERFNPAITALKKIIRLPFVKIEIKTVKGQPPKIKVVPFPGLHLKPPTKPTQVK